MSEVGDKVFTFQPSCVENTPIWRKSGRLLSYMRRKISSKFNVPLNALRLNPKISEKVFSRGKKNPTGVRVKVVAIPAAPEGTRQRFARLRYEVVLMESRRT